MFVLGDISGIQDFLFDVRESGGKQAAALRFRSLRLQLIIECIARRVLWGLDLPEKRLLYCAAGKFAIDATGAEPVTSRLGAIGADIEKWLLQRTHGQLRCAIIADESSGDADQRNQAAQAKLQRAKLRPWAAASWTPLVVPAIFDQDAEDERDAKFGRRLLEGESNTVQFFLEGDTADDDLAGVKISFSNRPPVPPAAGASSKSLDMFARHVPKSADGKLVEFVDLAKRSRGVPMLGVLKADADSLGIAIRARLANSPSFQPLEQFSKKLDRFFGETLGREMSGAASPWNSIYTVFAGGDDLLLVGPWNIVIDFAAHVRELFMQECQSDCLTISAGCAIIKPKFPIHLAAQQAEELLECAKSSTKDQFAAFGTAWKWSDHPIIIGVGKQLADWVDAGVIQRGWLHTLLELALLRREKSSPRDPKIIPAMATSRLSYHVARNWPKTGPARQWVDMLLRHFDNFDKATDPTMIYLPAILRYAMLASRSQGDIE